MLIRKSVLSFDLRPDPQLLKITSVCKSAAALFARGLGEHAQILQELDHEQQPQSCDD
jgi:hypothetical protein